MHLITTSWLTCSPGKKNVVRKPIMAAGITGIGYGHFYGRSLGGVVRTFHVFNG